MFSRHGIGEALAGIIALWAVVAAFTIRAWPASRSASLLFMPYLAWIGFAAALNFGIWLRNPKGGQAAKQHFLCFLPDPHGQGSFRPTLGTDRTNGVTVA